MGGALPWDQEIRFKDYSFHPWAAEKKHGRKMSRCVTLGAGLGMLVLGLIRKVQGHSDTPHFRLAEYLQQTCLLESSRGHTHTHINIHYDRNLESGNSSGIFLNICNVRLLMVHFIRCLFALKSIERRN